jgi:hypothetical protein
MTTTVRTDISTNKIDLALLPAFVSPLVAARLGVPAPSSVTELRPTGRPDCLTENGSGTCSHDHHQPNYSDGYGGMYAVGE